MVVLSMGLATLFLTVSLQFNLPPGLLSSLCYVESTHKINKIHVNDGSGNSVGICQIKLKTAKGLGFKGNEKKLMEPSTNIYYAGKYLSHQISRYDSINKGIIAYNMGHAGALTSTKYYVRVVKEWTKQYHTDALNVATQPVDVYLKGK